MSKRAFVKWFVGLLWALAILFPWSVVALAVAAALMGL